MIKYTDKFIKPIIVLIFLISCSNAEDSFFDKLPDLNINTEIINSSEPIVNEEDNFDPLGVGCLIEFHSTPSEASEECKKYFEKKNNEAKLIDSSELTFSEVDAIRIQYLRCWSVPMGIPDNFAVKIKISLRQDGSLMKPPEVMDYQRMNDPSQKAFKAIAESALRAIIRCDPIKTPSIDKYEVWKTILFNFDTSEILR